MNRKGILEWGPGVNVPTFFEVGFQSSQEGGEARGCSELEVGCWVFQSLRTPIGTCMSGVIEGRGSPLNFKCPQGFDGWGEAANIKSMLVRP